MKLSFYKKDNNWFINHLNWLIPEANRQMVAGCDQLLDMAADGKDEITIDTDSRNPKIILDRINICGHGGADYKVTTNIKHAPVCVWICNVTLFVFGYFPKRFNISW